MNCGTNAGPIKYLPLFGAFNFETDSVAVWDFKSGFKRVSVETSSSAAIVATLTVSTADPNSAGSCAPNAAFTAYFASWVGTDFNNLSSLIALAVKAGRNFCSPSIGNSAVFLASDPAAAPLEASRLACPAGTVMVSLHGYYDNNNIKAIGVVCRAGQWVLSVCCACGHAVAPLQLPYQETFLKKRLCRYGIIKLRLG